MLFRAPIDCGALGVRPGRAASAHYEHLKGASNGMARKFIKNFHAVQPIGGWYCVHRNDLRRIAPLWLDLTKQDSQNPQRYLCRLLYLPLVPPTTFLLHTAYRCARTHSATGAWTAFQALSQMVLLLPVLLTAPACSCLLLN